jgi:hypothetical protein
MLIWSVSWDVSWVCGGDFKG